MKHEQTIIHGIIIALALAAIVGAAATAIAVGRISELRYELTEAQSDADTYREGYVATLALRKRAVLLRERGVTGDEYYKTVDNCTLVNEDGSLNYDNEFVKMSFQTGRIRPV